ncbi:hypothetical protein J4219_00825 [Candidatus Woesearchaeota archaeon]|nr:hypothetical protein [Candidatus Woesearchaeota archaeon]
MNKRALSALVIGSTIALVYLFLPPKLIISAGLGILRHNDRVMIGTLGLIIAFVSAYALIKPRKDL